MNDIKQLISTLQRLRSEKDWTRMLALLESTDLNTIRGNELHHVLIEFFISSIRTGNHKQSLRLARHFDRTFVDDQAIRYSNLLLPGIRKKQKIVATFDHDRVPGEDEFVICYGDYPHLSENLACQNPVRRHLKYFWDIEHDVVEYHPVWDSVDAIYIINTDERLDRFVETLREMRRAKMPFHKLHRFSADQKQSTGDSFLDGTIGCAMSHLGAVSEAILKGYRQILIVEDDFCFLDGIEKHLENIRTFFNRQYDYHVCLLAASKYHQIDDYDELLSLSNQECTTCAGYFLSSEGMKRVREVWQSGLEELLETQDTLNACDRSWSKLQSEGKFFLFKQKIGFQRPSFSTITGKTAFYMD